MHGMLFVLLGALGINGCSARHKPLKECLLCNATWMYAPSNSQVWFQGQPSSGSPTPRAEIVIAHCREDMGWLADGIFTLQQDGTAVVKVTIYTKCGRLHGLPLQVHGVAIKSHILPNEGRNDQSFAHHIVRQYSNLTPLVLFIKGSLPATFKMSAQIPISHELSRLNEGAILRGFECGLPPWPAVTGSIWHDTATLLSFQMDKYQNYGSSNFTSPLRPTGRWLQAKLTPTAVYSELRRRKLVPVCYGGIFAVQRQRIASRPLETWRSIRNALSRGVDNIEEGHYVERLWAALLTPPLEPLLAKSLACAAAYVNRGGRGQVAGGLKSPGHLAVLSGCICKPACTASNS
mmetsp:Transcript_21765/g.35946  ORF Transcript_21765/g.35946 Transcript_21765/m.35946 type:complete len:348 (+) Transcript_21765:107-1150(+)